MQQFAGSTNWLRQHMRVEYGQAMKVLGEYLKPGASFPSEGLGMGASAGDLAVRAIKLMATQAIRLAVFDEAAAIDRALHPAAHIVKAPAFGPAHVFRRKARQRRNPFDHPR